MNALENDGVREGVKAYTNWPTIPQLYVKGEFDQRGSNIITEMFQFGDLQTLFNEKSIPANQARAVA